ncbi:heavy metal translocating P-type ATPase [Natroniella acetigena]|uniref:heavy metal translocating P-type ATPase n=1 Tax=Natroniella acetigena TaxID=52004 RepID=UPI0024A94173|nr:heavy metal translocating P-type ATPase [Natroniella acetigena]
MEAKKLVTEIKKESKAKNKAIKGEEKIDSNLKLKKMEKKIELILKGLGCADCAAKIEREVNKLSNIQEARLDFLSEKLTIITEQDGVESEIIRSVNKIINQIEPEVRVSTEEEVGMPERLEEENNNLQKRIIKLIVGSSFFVVALLFDLSFLHQLILYGTSYLIIGGTVVLKAIKNIGNGQVFDENFLMTIATSGAFAIGEFPEAVAVMLFYKVGEIFQARAVDHSRRSIKSLLEIKADYANLKVGDQIKQVPSEKIEVGDIVIIKAGDKVPVDGRVIDGEARIDTSALTGESVPQKITVGDEILSGFINQDGVLTVRVEKEFNNSAVAKVLDLVENAAAKKAPTENFITKFARYYTPLVVAGAFLVATIPPLFTGEAFSIWFYRALVFLVISCPCALVISIPLGFFGGIGAASKNGILVKGGNYLEALNNVKQVVFDKTGTLTEGVFQVIEVDTQPGWTEEEVLELAAIIELNSNHPIAKSIVEACPTEVSSEVINNYREISGQGLTATVKGKELLVGNQKLLTAAGVQFEASDFKGTAVYVSYGQEVLGTILISDQVKPDAQGAIESLRELKVEQLTMLTGDRKQAALQVKDYLKLDQYYAELLPENKVELMESFIQEKEEGGKVVFVGDGINDAPVLARSDIGVAMGGLGSDAAIEAADVVLMTDEPTKLVEAIKIARFTRRVVWQNIILALGVKGIILIMGLFGLTTMWAAIFADVGVALLAIFNALRIIMSQKFN